MDIPLTVGIIGVLISTNQKKIKKNEKNNNKK